MIQNRAIRYFMGVHRFRPILAITGDMGWVTSTHRRWVNLLRLWNRLVCTNNTRLTKIVFEYDYNRTGKTWCSDIKTILGQVGLLSVYKISFLLIWKLWKKDCWICTSYTGWINCNRFLNYEHINNLKVILVPKITYYQVVKKWKTTFSTV